MALGKMGRGISDESLRVANARLENPEIKPRASIQIANILSKGGGSVKKSRKKGKK